MSDDSDRIPIASQPPFGRRHRPAVPGRGARRARPRRHARARRSTPSCSATTFRRRCKLLSARRRCSPSLLGSSLKIDGRFILQTQTDGPVRMLVVDFRTPGQIRAYARFDADAVAAAIAAGEPTPATLLGRGTSP